MERGKIPSLNHFAKRRLPKGTIGNVGYKAKIRTPSKEEKKTLGRPVPLD